MHVDVEALRRYYASLETSQLLHLRAFGSLRDDAAAVLAEELASRSVEDEELDAIHAQIETVRAIGVQASSERRALARAVDAAVVLPPTFALWFALWSLGIPAPASLWVALACASTLFWTLDALFSGRSPGKRALGLRIVDVDARDRRPARRALLRRNLLPLLATVPGAVFLVWMETPALLPLGVFAFALAAVETHRLQSHRRLGDRRAGTVVIGDR